jgi:GT2 family glycosyltransferase
LPPSAIILPDTDEPLVSIIIPVHNQVKLTLDCLSSLAQATVGIDFEVLVGDDQSSDSTSSKIGSIPGVRLFSHAENLGFLRNVNALAQHARGRYLVILNNDTLVLDDWLSPLVRVLEEDETVAVV